MTHTRGPWKAEGWRGVIVNDSLGRTLSVCPGETAEEAAANAALIAAAPDLLAALRAMLKTHDPTITDEMEEARAAARAAIAKAEGKGHE